MHNLTLALSGAWKVLVVGLVLGAGLPALFGVGIKLMALGAGGTAGTGSSATPGKPVGKVLAYLVFAVVVLIALIGITYIVASGFGKTLSFEHIFPTIVDK